MDNFRQLIRFTKVPSLQFLNGKKHLAHLYETLIEGNFSSICLRL